MIADIKRRTINRTNVIEGQVKALRKAIESETYCMDILTQSLAIQKSLASLNKLILENHIRTHITEMMASNHQSEQQQALDELLKLYELNNIRGK